MTGCSLNGVVYSLLVSPVGWRCPVTEQRPVPQSRRSVPLAQHSGLLACGRVALRGRHPVAPYPQPCECHDDVKEAAIRPDGGARRLDQHRLICLCRSATRRDGSMKNCNESRSPCPRKPPGPVASMFMSRCRQGQATNRRGCSARSSPRSSLTSIRSRPRSCGPSMRGDADVHRLPPERPREDLSDGL
jgi:hypothetical protein